MYSNADTEFKFKTKKTPDELEEERILTAIRQTEKKLAGLKQNAAIKNAKQLLEKLYFRLQKHREKMNNK